MNGAPMAARRSLGMDGVRAGVNVLWARLCRHASRIAGQAARELVPALCPVCRAVLRPPGAWACESCDTAMMVLPTPRCSACGGSQDGVLEVCTECLHAGPRPWTRAVSAFRFRGVVRDAVHRLKYQHDTALVPPLAAAMAENWRRHGCPDADVVTPVPLHWSRRMRRGYNQAELLARFAARELGLPCQALLRRRRSTAQQAMLDAERRQTNVRGVFAPRPANRGGGQRVLLIDDVLTTGATLAEAARVLMTVDVAAVYVLTAARG